MSRESDFEFMVKFKEQPNEFYPAWRISLWELLNVESRANAN